MTDDMTKRAKLRCMHLLEKRDYTEEELRRKLRNGKSDYTEEQIDSAIAYVKGYRYVDDGRYARQYISTMQERKSRRQIEQELFLKGVSREEVQQAFEETEVIPEEILIRKWMEKRHYDAQNADLKEKQRMYAFLMRKGFSAGAVSHMLQTGLNEYNGF